MDALRLEVPPAAAVPEEDSHSGAGDPAEGSSLELVGTTGGPSGSPNGRDGADSGILVRPRGQGPHMMDSALLIGGTYPLLEERTLADVETAVAAAEAASAAAAAVLQEVSLARGPPSAQANQEEGGVVRPGMELQASPALGPILAPSAAAPEIGRPPTSTFTIGDTDSIGVCFDLLPHAESARSLEPSPGLTTEENEAPEGRVGTTEGGGSGDSMGVGLPSQEGSPRVGEPPSKG